VRAVPICRLPVGEGAIRTRTFLEKKGMFMIYFS
jgi:hypothetical protein